MMVTMMMMVVTMFHDAVDLCYVDFVLLMMTLLAMLFTYSCCIVFTYSCSIYIGDMFDIVIDVPKFSTLFMHAIYDWEGQPGTTVVLPVSAPFSAPHLPVLLLTGASSSE